MPDSVPGSREHRAERKIHAKGLVDPLEPGFIFILKSRPCGFRPKTLFPTISFVIRNAVQNTKDSVYLHRSVPHNSRVVQSSGSPL
jgi:hypothetical protein